MAGWMEECGKWRWNEKKEKGRRNEKKRRRRKWGGWLVDKTLWAILPHLRHTHACRLCTCLSCLSTPNAHPFITVHTHTPCLSAKVCWPCLEYIFNRCVYSYSATYTHTHTHQQAFFSSILSFEMRAVNEGRQRTNEQGFVWSEHFFYSKGGWDIG